MKIALIIDTWFPHLGGGQINAWEISRRLAAEGLEIDIITRNNGTNNLIKLPRNLKIYKLGSPAKPYDFLSKIIFCVRSVLFILNHPYDLIHAHAFLPGIIARFLMVFKGVPAILTVHGTALNTNLHHFFGKFIEKFILTEIRYSAQITVSRDFLKIKNINKKVFYVPNGIDLKGFAKTTVQKFPNPTLIFVGRLHRQKNLITLLKTMKLVKLEIPQVKLLVVGTGPEKSKLIALSQKLKLQKTVRFLGEVTGRQLIKLYKFSHLFILPSIYEGQPLTLLEAWAAKLPVIVSRTGDCQYLVKNGRDGYLINNPDDAWEIANIIKKALQNKNLNVLGENGYKLVKKNFSWEKSTQETLKIYERLIESKD